MKSTSQVVSSNGQTIANSTQTLSQKLHDFVKLVSQNVAKLRSETNDFQTKELGTLASYVERVDQQLLRLQHALQAVQSSEASEAEALDTVKTIVWETHQTIKTSFGTWSERFKRTCDEMNAEIKLSGIDALGAVEADLKTMGSLIETVTRETRELIDADLEAANTARMLTSEKCKHEVVLLQQQNEALVALLESERLKADNAKDELVRRFSAFLGEFTVERDRSLREAFKVIQSANQEQENEAEFFGEQHGKLMEQIKKQGTEVNGQLQRRSGEGKRTRDGAFKVSSRCNRCISRY